MAQLLDIYRASGKSGDGDLTIGIGGVRAGNPCSTSGIGVDAKLPACQVLIVLSGLGQVQPGRIQLIHKADRSSLTSGERDLLRIGTGTAVHGIDCTVGVSHLLNVYSASREIRNGNSAIGIRGMGTGNPSGTSCIRVDAKLPARQVLAVLSCLCQIQSGGIQLVHKADRSSLTDGECDFLRIGAGTGVHCIDGGILVAQLLDVHSASGKPGDGDLTIDVGSVRAGDPCSTSSIGVDTELPARKVLAVLCGLGQIQSGRVQLIHKADRSGLTSGKRNLLRISAGTGVHSVDSAVGVPQLLDVHSTSREIRNGNLAVGVSGMGTGDQCSAGRIGIDAELPACQIFAILSSLGQIQPTGVQLVIEADRRSLSSGEGDSLGIGAGAGVHGVDCAVAVAQLLDVDGASGKVGYRDGTIGIRGMGTGDQCSAGRVGIDTELPARKILAILSGFLDAQGSSGRCLQLEVGIQIAAGGRSQGDGSLVRRTGHIPDIIGGIACGGNVAGSLEHR